MFLSCQHNTGQHSIKTAHKSLKNVAIFISSNKPKLHSQSNLRANNIQGTHANKPHLLSYLPTTKYRETICPAVEYGMRNLVCHNKGRTLN